MTSLVVMNESLVTRMVNDVVAQRRIPPLCPRSDAPIRLSEPNKARKHRWSPDSIRIGTRRETGASPLQFSKNRLLERLCRLGNAVNPKRESSRFDQIGDGGAKASRFHPPQRFNSTGLLRSGMGQTAGRENLAVHSSNVGHFAVECGASRPSCVPTSPGLLHSEVLVRVYIKASNQPSALALAKG
jgi:hypothetical protein